MLFDQKNKKVMRKQKVGNTCATLYEINET